MNTIKQVILAALLAVATVYGQGSLTPNSAPAPTMKTLDQVEPRIPISEIDSSITNSGSYYLANNLIIAGPHSGITISSSDVTLDLNGFTIDGSAASRIGIGIDTGCNNVLIKNGTIRGCYSQAISAYSSSDCTYTDLRVIGNARSGAGNSALYLGTGSVVENCRIENNTGIGINVKGDSRIVGNRVIGNGGTGLRLTESGSYVADNIVKDNAENYNLSGTNQLNLILSQIPVTLEWPCSVKLAGTLNCISTTADGITVAADDVTIDMNGHSLIGPGSGSGSGVFQSSAYNNLRIFNGKAKAWGNYGFEIAGKGAILNDLQAATNQHGISDGPAGTISSCSSFENSNVGFYLGPDSTISDCEALNNGSWGVIATSGSKVSRCTLTENSTGGAWCFFGSQIEECIVRENADGIEASSDCVIRNNTITDNTDNGIQLTSHGNLVENNVVKDNADNYNFADGNQLNLLLCEVPETLDWPCSVKFAGTLVCSSNGVNGIDVNADNVTIDLAGHALVGPGTSSKAIGIYQKVSHHCFSVYNGKVTNWKGDDETDGCGIAAYESTIKDIQVYGNDFGIVCGMYYGDKGGLLSDCVAYSNANTGIYGRGCHIQNCLAHDNPGYGFQARGSTVKNCIASGNNIGFYGTYAQIDSCTAEENKDSGIYCSYSCRITGNLCTGNTTNGIFVSANDNTIDANTLVNNSAGLHVDDSGNIITRNTATGNTSSNYHIDDNNKVGTIQKTPVGAGAWDNFEY